MRQLDRVSPVYVNTLVGSEPHLTDSNGQSYVISNDSSFKLNGEETVATAQSGKICYFHPNQSRNQSWRVSHDRKFTLESLQDEHYIVQYPDQNIFGSNVSIQWLRLIHYEPDRMLMAGRLRHFGLYQGGSQYFMMLLFSSVFGFIT